MCRDVWVSRDSVHLSVWWLGSLTWRTIADADVYEVRPSIYNSLCYMNIRNIFYEKCELLPTLYWAWYSWILLSIGAISRAGRVASLLLPRRGMSYQPCSHSVAFLCLQMVGKKSPLYLLHIEGSEWRRVADGTLQVPWRAVKTTMVTA